MSRHHWEYSEAPGHEVGAMICTACRKPIMTGQFRYRETDEAYLPQHRACSSDDPKWARLDAREAKWRDYDRRRREAFKRFVAQWGLPDDLIEEQQ